MIITTNLNITKKKINIEHILSSKNGEFKLYVHCLTRKYHLDPMPFPISGLIEIISDHLGDKFKFNKSMSYYNGRFATDLYVVDTYTLYGWQEDQNV